MDEILFEFDGGLDAANFIVATYLAGWYTFDNNNPTTPSFRTVTSLQPYWDLVRRGQVELAPIIVDPNWGYQPEDIQRIRRYLANAEDPNAPFAPSIYGYLYPPTLLYRPNSDTPVMQRLRRRAVGMLLAADISPRANDRWDRPLHAYVDLAPIQWRTILLRYDYTLCEPNAPDNVRWVYPDAFTALITTAGTEPLTGLILTENELADILLVKPACHDRSYLAMLHHVIAGQLQARRPFADQINRTQLHIFDRALAAEENRLLREEAEEPGRRAQALAMYGTYWG